ncbi:MAG: uroporphyrinogen-III C-methyltransferase [Acetobacteraceae bacterium]|nr:uroporphyrinogen-III C-methyltransferase [Acetobacteraceae bacterium]
MTVPVPPEPSPFPVFLRLAGERVLVVGGGEEAAAKLRLLSPCGATVAVVAPVVCEAVQAMADAGEIALAVRGFTPADLAGVRLCIATGPEAELVAAAAHAAGVLVNAVDRPAISDCLVPAIVERAPITVAIGTGGAAPALARDLRARIEAAVPAGYGVLASLCRAWRGRVARALPDRAARRHFWDAVLEGPEAAAALDGDAAEAERLLARRLTAASRGGSPPPLGRASLVGAGPGNPELLTLRALRILKRADVILYDALIDPAVLDLARREARRIDVGKRCGRHPLNQAAINRLILTEAQAGAHVVRLKGGDPLIFGRGGEEIDCLRAAGVPVEVVPGITAAAAVAAALGIPLTHRELARAVHLMTGHGRDGAVPAHAWGAIAEGGTVAAYMAARSLAVVAARLEAAGLAPETPAVAVENASRPNQRHLFGTLADLPAALDAARFDGPTLVLIGQVVGLADAANAEPGRQVA